MRLRSKLRKRYTFSFLNKQWRQKIVMLEKNSEEGEKKINLTKREDKQTTFEDNA